MILIIINRITEEEHQIQVFGMVDISHSPALGSMEIVACRDAATLLPIINDHVAPGTEVWSDEWSAYNHVGSLPNELFIQFCI